MISMRLPESETTKVLVPVAARSAPVLSKAAPVQVPPEYRLKLYLPNPVVGSNVLVPTSVRRFTAALNGVPTTGASDSVKTPQEFPAASRVNCSTRVELNGTTFGAVAQSATAVKPELTGISVLTLRFQLLYRPYDLSVQVFRRCWSTGFPAAPGGAGFAS